ncbi:MAG: AbrB/MazE/SpoVT family DNA-binding domain-containing protein [Candidatus Omnitrophica bacterium]|nr:AbrB/MazE/SpoVT family DNA-binding domain-containing protein [Candidatus Omnitrophota bacterium]
MVLTVQQWGNSLAVRLPKPLAQRIHVHKGSQLDLAVVDNKLVLSAGRTMRYDLKSLVRKIKATHPDQDTGRPVGQEIW